MFKKFFIDKSHTNLVQLTRYMMAGVFCFVIDFSTLYALKEYLGLYYLVASALAFLTGIAINYILNVIWVFPKRAYKEKIHEMTIFLLIEIVALILLVIFMWLFTDVLKMYYLASKACATGLVFFWNYYAKKHILFNKHHTENDKDKVIYL